MKHHGKKHVSVISVLLCAFLLFYTCTLLFMYFWGFFTSLKTTDQFMKDMIWLPPGVPWNWAWGNYGRALELFSTTFLNNGRLVTVTFTDMLGNSLLYSFVGPLISVTVTWLMAYITATYPGRASKFIYSVNMVVMLVPIVGSLPSALQIYTRLRLYDTWGYVIVSAIGFVGSNYLIFYAYFRTIAGELREAAMIDGAGNFTVMTRIIFPLTLNMYGILFLMAFIGRWNDYMTMVIWLPSKPNLAYGMYRFSTNTATGGSWPPVQIAGCMILMIPILIIFLIFKDKVIGRVTIGSLK